MRREGSSPRTQAKAKKPKNKEESQKQLDKLLKEINPKAAIKRK